MADLRDGESVEVQGSASRPYVLKNVGGVYSCNCPAWRNQSLPIERRTCKHLRRLRGDEAEAARVGGRLPTSITAISTRDDKTPPALLLAEAWDGDVDPAGWWMSEKLDGVRAFWNDHRFHSRQGNMFHAPDWFVAGLPVEPLDGELWIGRKMFQRTVSVVRRQDKSDLWREVRFLIFDAPDAGSTFEQRLQTVERIVRTNRPAFARAHEHSLCSDADHLRRELARVESLGGEGLMLRQPGSLYQAGRSATLLKVKSFADAEARVVGHEPGQGRHKGRLGALLVELANGIRFAVGTGLSDSERSDPPPIGSVITFRYQELTDAGVPRFPTYVGVRAGAPPISTRPQPTHGETIMPKTTAQVVSKRRFEFVGGGSDKFWEIEVGSRNVAVRFGRNGNSGQITSKSFPTSTAAEQHAEKLVKQKLAKGYVEMR